MSSVVDRWIADFVMWREREPDESDRVLNGVRALDLIVPTRVLLSTDDYMIPFEQPVSIEDVHEALDAEALDTVMLADRRHVMLVDDAGQAKRLPMNRLATGFYWQKCGQKSGPWVIRGDVLIVPDSDYKEEDSWH